MQSQLYEDVQDLLTLRSVEGVEQDAELEHEHNVQTRQELLQPPRYPAVGLSVELHGISHPPVNLVAGSTPLVYRGYHGKRNSRDLTILDRSLT